MPTSQPTLVRAVCIDAEGARPHLIEGAEYLIPEPRSPYTLVAAYRPDGTCVGCPTVRGDTMPFRWYQTRFRVAVSPEVAETRKREANLKRRTIECPKVNLP